MFFKRRFLLLSIISFGVLSLAISGLYQVSKNGSLVPAVMGIKSGAMYFEGDRNVVVSQPFVLKVMIDSNNQNVNAAGFFMKYDPDKIMVNEVITTESFCQFYPEKKFDNRLGLVSLACGSPHPGLKGKNKLVELSITPLSIGTTFLRVAPESKILLSDGKGTNILTDYPSWEVQIGAGL